MPVTAKLSREFYDRFGDKVVDELVGLLNNMDATFRAELRELNDVNFQRFEARLDQRISELGSALRTEMADLKGQLSHQIADLETRLVKETAEVATKTADLKAELIKWMFLFWLGTVATMLGFGRFFLPG